MNNAKRITRTAIVILLASVGWLIALGDGTDIDTDIQPRTVASSCPLSMSFAVGGFTDPFAMQVPRVPAGARTNIIYPASIAPAGPVSGDESIRRAKTELDRSARAFRLRCPISTVRVIAYSLGAAAASDVCTAWQTDRQMQLNTTCALIGNPKRPLAADGKGGIMGQLPTILPGLTHTGFRPPTAGPIEITEICNARDLYCSATRDRGQLADAAFGTYLMGTHTGY